MAEDGGLDTMVSPEASICTIYVKNLEERVKLDPLKSALRTIFSQFGTVLEVSAKRNLRARGQAFVILDNPASARQAIEEVQGFELFDKPMVLQLARARSDLTVEREGGKEGLEDHKRWRVAEKEKRLAYEAAEQQKLLKRPALAGPGGPSGGADRTGKAGRGAGLKPTGPAAAAVVPDEYLPPNKILFVQNLPDDFDIDALTAIFGRFDGFREVRLVPGRRGIAFVEYQAEQGAITAKEATSGMALRRGEKIMKVTYQRQ